MPAAWEVLSPAGKLHTTVIPTQYAATGAGAQALMHACRPLSANQEPAARQPQSRLPSQSGARLWVLPMAIAWHQAT
ncbi:hypothetical protein HaLaN_26030 [Haematococcus lacustris]|uniref:Uncharacterized protein n=1 Tax=Haematococcus lacustris TaxID=44745 RepID=A0A6A0A597_HAELA|nr:hypothetical protein HaLaN_26030 [Haematococcus lacustris]